MVQSSTGALHLSWKLELGMMSQRTICESEKPYCCQTFGFCFTVVSLQSLLLRYQTDVVDLSFTDEALWFSAYMK